MSDKNEITILAHWVYTRDEWRIFIRKENRRRNFLQWLFQWVTGSSTKTVPEVKFAHGKILVGETMYHFNSNNINLRRINILEAGLINIMEICYETKGKKFPQLIELRIPIPRGKLKEAVMVQEKFSVISD